MIYRGSTLLAGAVPEPLAEASSDDHSFKAAVAVYLRLKGNDRPPTFEAAVTALLWLPDRLLWDERPP